MPEINAVVGTLTVPIWAAGAASAVLLAAIVLAIARAGAATSVNVLLRAGAVAAAVAGGWFYMQRLEQQQYATERRLFEERSAALLARAIAPGSALSCLDEVAGETVEIACEKAVFGSPQSVAAAVNYITAKMALLIDGSDPARGVGATFAAELVPLRAALELDRFGIVAHVLAQRNGCTADTCETLAWFIDQSHLLANLRDHTFDEHVAKFVAAWNGSPGAAVDGTAVVPSMAALPQNPAPAVVSPRYDFPSSQSIPPVNIMVPESAAPRVGAPTGVPSTAPADGNSRAAVTPVPPRRPPQGRPGPAAAASRPPTQQPAAPNNGGETSTDGAVPSQSGAIEPR